MIPITANATAAPMAIVHSSVASSLPQGPHGAGGFAAASSSAKATDLAAAAAGAR